LTENNPDHLGRIRAIAIDGARAATASFDNSITIWQLPGGRRLATLKPPDVEKGQIRDVAFAKNGKMLISAHSDGAVRRWDLRDLNHCREIDFHKKHTRDVFGVAVTPDGRIVLSASEDKTLCIWRPEENRFDFLPGRPRENDGFLLDLVRLAIRPFLPGREDDADVDGDDRDYVGHSSGVNTVAITGDGLRAVSGSDDMNVRRWNLESEESGAFKYSKVMRRQRFGSCSHRHQVLDVAISRDGRKALSASKDGTVKLWDLDRGIELLKLDAHSGWVVAVAFGREDEWAASVSVDGDVRIWDLRDAASLEKERLLAYYPTEAPLFSCAVTPDGDMIVAGDTAGRLHFFDVKYPASVERRVP
jgi:WD40 repeat protein